jgi:hypothetical protein
MPALPVVPNVLKLTIEGNQGAFTWANAFHWSYTGGAPSAGNAGDVASDLLADWIGNFGPLASGGVEFTRATCVDLSSDLGATGEASGATAGGRAGTAVAPALAVLISKTIGRRYRGGHPRMYVVGGVEADFATASTWSGGLVGDVQAAWAAVSAALNALVVGTTTLSGEVTVSYTSKALNPVAPYRRAVPLVFPVTGHTTQAQIAIQRRRLGR